MNTQTFSSVYTFYEQFLADPSPAARHVHIVQTDTDASTFLRQEELFAALVSTKPATPALILQPRRLGALWFAHTYAEQMDVLLGKELGLSGLRGRQLTGAGNTQDHHVVFSTCANALSHPQLLHETQCVVLCNTQTKPLNMTLIKAVLKKRLQEEKRLFLVVYTNDATQFLQDSAYFSDIWQQTQDVVVGYHPHQGWPIDFPCNYRESDRSVSDVLEAYLVLPSPKTGIVVCVTDQHTANIVENRIAAVCDKNDLTHVEVAVVSNRSQFETRDPVLRQPDDGDLRVLINIGALESSGISIDWINVVISDGMEPSFHPMGFCGGVQTKPIHASQSVIRQQARIIGNPADTEYVLCSKLPFAERPALSAGDIQTFPHTEIVLHALEAGLNPFTLELGTSDFSDFDANIACLQLHNLGLVDYTRAVDPITGYVKPIVELTHNGRQGGYLRLGIVSKAVLTAAKRLDIVADILPILATLEAGGMRHMTMAPHMLDPESDILDATLAFAYALKLNNLPAEHRVHKAEEYNVSFRSVRTAQRILENLVRYTGVEPDFHYYRHVTPTPPDAIKNVLGGVGAREQLAELRMKLKACLFVGHLHALYWNENPRNPAIARGWFSQGLSAYRIGNASVVREGFANVISGSLAKITTKATQKSFVIIEGVTSYTADELHYVGKMFPDMIERISLPIIRQVYFQAPVPKLAPYPTNSERTKTFDRLAKSAKPSLVGETEAFCDTVDQMTVVPAKLEKIELSVVPPVVETVKVAKPQEQVITHEIVDIPQSTASLAAAWGAKLSASSRRR